MQGADMMNGMANFSLLHLTIISLIVLLLFSNRLPTILRSLAGETEAAPIDLRAYWTMIYGMLLANAITLIYLLSNREHRIGDFFASWQNFLLFAVIVAVAAVSARAIANRFHERE
jgi:hypothetical protein